MECGDTPHSIISIWIQIWIWIWSVDLHGVWRHSTFHNIHMNKDVAPCLHIFSHMECGDILQSLISIWIQIWIWIWSVDLHGVWRHSTFHNIHMNKDVAPCLHIFSHMECGDILQSIISIWIQIWIWIRSVDLHGVWGHSTLCYIHMDTDKDMDMECASTWSVETLYIP